MSFNSFSQGQRNLYLYNGKELQEDLGFGSYAFEARMYDPWIGRTFQIDPHSENYQSYSGYHWTGNSPINNIDPDGRDWYRFKNKDGESSYIWREGDAESIEVDGNTYSNVGTTHVDRLSGGTMNIYYQNEIIISFSADDKIGDAETAAALHRIIDPDADVRSNTMTSDWDLLFFAAETALMISGEAGSYGGGFSRRTPRFNKGNARGRNHTIDNVTSMSNKVPRKGAAIYKNKGSASLTFKKMALHYKPTKIQTSGNTKYFTTKDGKTVTLRSSSTDTPTISIQTKGVSRQTKIRFDHE